MRCTDIMRRLEVLAPLGFAEKWDNVGLLAGRSMKEVKSVYLAVDATDEVIEDAIDCEADMLITHHPLIFTPLKSITAEDFIGRRVLRLLHSVFNYVVEMLVNVFFVYFHGNYRVVVTACVIGNVFQKMLHNRMQTARADIFRSSIYIR